MELVILLINLLILLIHLPILLNESVIFIIELVILLTYGYLWWFSNSCPLRSSSSDSILLNELIILLNELVILLNELVILLNELVILLNTPFLSTLACHKYIFIYLFSFMVYL